MALQNEYHHLIDIVRENVYPSDSRQELAPKIVSALKPRGYFSLLLPKTLGGAQVDYPDYIDLVLRFAEVDASTAWCINQGSVLASLARLLDPDTAKKIWPSPEISLANGPPSGTCESIQTDDGYQLTGSWTFSSGIAHADWLIGIAKTAMKDGDQTPMMHLLPKSAALIQKTWDVVGLRQTGSYEFSTEALLVPKHLTFAYQIKEGEFPLYQIPLNLLFAGGFAAVALGTSRAAIDHAIERCRLKIKRFAKTTMQQDSATQDIIGHVEANWRAAKSYLVSTVEETWLAIIEQGSCPKDSKYQLRLASTHAIRQAKIATDMVYHLCGTDSIHQSEPIHRCFQDVHVISQHLQARPEVYAIVGGHLLGLPVQSYLVD